MSTPVREEPHNLITDKETRPEQIRDIDTGVITEAEICQAFKKTQNGKATGYDRPSQIIRGGRGHDSSCVSQIIQKSLAL